MVGIIREKTNFNTDFTGRNLQKSERSCSSRSCWMPQTKFSSKTTFQSLPSYSRNTHMTKKCGTISLLLPPVPRVHLNRQKWLWINTQRIIKRVKNLSILFLSLGEGRYLETIIFHERDYVLMELRDFRKEFNKLALSLKFASSEPLPINLEQEAVDR